MARTKPVTASTGVKIPNIKNETQTNTTSASSSNSSHPPQHVSNNTQSLTSNTTNSISHSNHLQSINNTSNNDHVDAIQPINERTTQHVAASLSTTQLSVSNDIPTSISQSASTTVTATPQSVPAFKSEHNSIINNNLQPAHISNVRSIPVVSSFAPVSQANNNTAVTASNSSTVLPDQLIPHQSNDNTTAGTNDNTSPNTPVLQRLHKPSIVNKPSQDTTTPTTSNASGVNDVTMNGNDLDNDNMKMDDDVGNHGDNAPDSSMHRDSEPDSSESDSELLVHQPLINKHTNNKAYTQQTANNTSTSNIPAGLLRADQKPSPDDFDVHDCKVRTWTPDDQSAASVYYYNYQWSAREIAVALKRNYKQVSNLLYRWKTKKHNRSIPSATTSKSINKTIQSTPFTQSNTPNIPNDSCMDKQTTATSPVNNSTPVIQNNTEINKPVVSPSLITTPPSPTDNSTPSQSTAPPTNNPSNANHIDRRHFDTITVANNNIPPVPATSTSTTTGTTLKTPPSITTATNNQSTDTTSNATTTTTQQSPDSTNIQQSSTTAYKQPKATQSNPSDIAPSMRRLSAKSKRVDVFRVQSECESMIDSEIIKNSNLTRVERVQLLRRMIERTRNAYELRILVQVMYHQQIITFIRDTLTPLIRDMNQHKQSITDCLLVIMIIVGASGTDHAVILPNNTKQIYRALIDLMTALDQHTDESIQRYARQVKRRLNREKTQQVQVINSQKRKVDDSKNSSNNNTNNKRAATTTRTTYQKQSSSVSGFADLPKPSISVRTHTQPSSRITTQSPNTVPHETLNKILNNQFDLFGMSINNVRFNNNHNNEAATTTPVDLSMIKSGCAGVADGVLKLPVVGRQIDISDLSEEQIERNFPTNKFQQAKVEKGSTSSSSNHHHNRIDISDVDITLIPSDQLPPLPAANSNLRGIEWRVPLIRKLNSSKLVRYSSSALPDEQLHDQQINQSIKLFNRNDASAAAARSSTNHTNQYNYGMLYEPHHAPIRNAHTQLPPIDNAFVQQARQRRFESHNTSTSSLLNNNNNTTQSGGTPVPLQQSASDNIASTRSHTNRTPALPLPPSPSSTSPDKIPSHNRLHSMESYVDRVAATQSNNQLPTSQLQPIPHLSNPQLQKLSAAISNLQAAQSVSNHTPTPSTHPSTMMHQYQPHQSRFEPLPAPSETPYVHNQSSVAYQSTSTLQYPPLQMPPPGVQTNYNVIAAMPPPALTSLPPPIPLSIPLLQHQSILPTGISSPSPAVSTPSTHSSHSNSHPSQDRDTRDYDSQRKYGRANRSPINDSKYRNDRDRDRHSSDRHSRHGSSRTSYSQERSTRYDREHDRGLYTNHIQRSHHTLPSPDSIVFTPKSSHTTSSPTTNNNNHTRVDNIHPSRRNHIDGATQPYQQSTPPHTNTHSSGSYYPLDYNIQPLQRQLSNPPSPTQLPSATHIPPQATGDNT